jgi:L-ascorbate metabolism protein UlaG (beta-lactamase superfamily)
MNLGIALADLPPIDFVLVSHGHYDHLDLRTLSRIAAIHRARVITHLGNDVILRNFDRTILVEAYDWNDRIDLGGGIAVTLLASRHWSACNLSDPNMALSASFVIETPRGRIYFVADSGYGDEHYFRSAREHHGPFKLLFCRDCGAEIALAHHHGTFQLTDEPSRGYRDRLLNLKKTKV